MTYFVLGFVELLICAIIMELTALFCTEVSYCFFFKIKWGEKIPTFRIELGIGGKDKRKVAATDTILSTITSNGTLNWDNLLRVTDDGTREFAFRNHLRELKELRTPILVIMAHGPELLRKSIMADEELKDVKDSNGVTPESIQNALDTGSALPSVREYVGHVPEFKEKESMNYKGSR